MGYRDLKNFPSFYFLSLSMVFKCCKKYIFAFLLPISLGLQAQTFTYKTKDFRNGNEAPMQGNPGDLFMSTITFSNPGASTIYIFIDRYQKSVPPYWALCYCYIQCHSPTDDTVTVEVQPFSTTDISLQFKTDSVNPGICTAYFKMH